MKAVSDTLGVARFNIAERIRGRSKRISRTREGDLDPSAELRCLVDARPTYGCRRTAALLRRERRFTGLLSVNAKRVYRLRNKHGLQLARYAGWRHAREHDGQGPILYFDVRLCSGVLEFTCWNGEAVRLAFVLDCHDGEVIGWTATTDGQSGEIIRDMMVHCVEARFGSCRALHRLRWLSDNGWVYAIAQTIGIAFDLNLDPCYTPVESPESNGHAGAFVKTIRRDYFRVIPNAEAAFAAISLWMGDYNDVHPHSRPEYGSHWEYIRALSQPAACPV
ncbi:IS3 family transposase [Alsobacter sp. KACC 23698]|uniref:IS3 family transposase n=1 Tax=Alsobacter sp. KACC 23698 TaxID=3149229 RepID=A0AAU7JK15_9HYPH